MTVIFHGNGWQAWDWERDTKLVEFAEPGRFRSLGMAYCIVASVCSTKGSPIPLLVIGGGGRGISHDMGCSTELLENQAQIRLHTSCSGHSYNCDYLYRSRIIG